MREIKFRGFSIDTDQWVYGFYRQYPVYKSCGKCLKRINHFIDIMGDKPHSEFVNPDTIGQFIGLKDTRANDVYEDDLLHDEDGAIIQVIYYSGCFGFIYPHQDPDTRYFYNFYDSALETKDITVIPFKIVGNIHDNPELLTKTE